MSVPAAVMAGVGPACVSPQHGQRLQPATAACSAVLLLGEPRCGACRCAGGCLNLACCVAGFSQPSAGWLASVQLAGVAPTKRLDPCKVVLGVAAVCVPCIGVSGLPLCVSRLGQINSQVCAPAGPAACKQARGRFGGMWSLALLLPCLACACQAHGFVVFWVHDLSHPACTCWGRVTNQTPGGEPNPLGSVLGVCVWKPGT